MKHLQEKEGEHSNPIRVLGDLLYNHAVYYTATRFCIVTRVKGMDFTGLTTFIHITTGPNEPGVVVPLMHNCLV